MATRRPCIVVATLGFLAAAARATAGRTWVFRSRRYTPSAGAWATQTTYPTASECAEAIDYREVLTAKNGFTVDPRTPKGKVTMVAHCLRCPRNVEYTDLVTLREVVAVAETECALGDGPCWLAWAERAGYLCDTVDQREGEGSAAATPVS